jgi:DNA (cytosine-5)-methyltransferase 1
MKPAVNARRFALVDLFAGCGGLSLGLEQAGFTPVFVNELNPDALNTYKVNRIQRHGHLDKPGFFVDDVKKMVANEAFTRRLNRRLLDTFGIHKGELDLLVGGPPCQGYSGIGHRRSYSVDKAQLPSNHLFQDMAAVIHRMQPRMFLFENVRGLLHSRWQKGGGSIFADVLGTFRALPHYRVAHSLVYAKDYGVPQNRPRVLLIGIRNDIHCPKESDSEDAVERGFLPSKTSLNPPDLVDLLGDLIDRIAYRPGGATLAYPSPPANSIQTELRTSTDGLTVFGEGSPLTEHEYSNHSDKVVTKFRAMLTNGGVIPSRYRTKKFSQRLLPKHWGAAGPSITATSLPDDYVHFEQPRTLTVREWARLQTFPDWYRFSGKRTTGGLRRAGNPREGLFDREVPKYTQIGNAVPVLLARTVGEHLRKILQAN